MICSFSLISWDTSVKHYIRNGLYDNLPTSLKAKLPKSNKHCWENETDDKYTGCEINSLIKEEIELLKQTGEFKNAKKVMDAYFKLSDSYHEIFSSVKVSNQRLQFKKQN